jgi:hypothetical protein
VHHILDEHLHRINTDEVLQRLRGVLYHLEALLGLVLSWSVFPLVPGGRVCSFFTKPPPEGQPPSGCPANAGPTLSASSANATVAVAITFLIRPMLTTSNPIYSCLYYFAQ